MLCGASGSGGVSWHVGTVLQAYESSANASLVRDDCGPTVPILAKIFQSLQAFPKVVLPVIVVYLLCRRIIPRYAVAIALLTGVVVASFTMQASQHIDLALVKPVLTLPTFSIEALLGLGVPLFLLALTQHATGVTVLRNEGYDVSPKTIVGGSGIISIPLAFFGSPGANLAAIVGAICASSECHPDPKRRYISGVVCAVGYLCVDVFGASVVAMFSLMPSGLIATLAGLALLGTLVSSLAGSLSDEKVREAALITFVVTVSGMSLFGLGSALWGLLAGLIFTYALSWKGFRKS